MISHVRARHFIVAAALVVFGPFGCGGGGPPAREDIVNAPPGELHGASMKALLYEFRAKVRRRGLAAAQDELPALLEAFDGYQQQPVGSHKETYRQIVDKLNAIQSELKGPPTKAQIVKSADELGELAAKLPGKADENPEVE